ncbi:MAG TPA: hypothetical protein P5513_06870 [Candidatus Diapherotrites archaeon]|nr:hypothetical protein [Candidatus Diapherotrites archaeon]
MLNWETKDTLNFVDRDNKMMLCQNPSWNPNGDNGKGDAIGRTFISYFCYGDPRFIEGVFNCWVKVYRKGWLKKLLFGEYYYQGYRYPTYANGTEKEPVGLSRDHLTYTVLLFKYAGFSEDFLKDFVTHLRFRISKRYFMTIDLWLWLRVIANIKPYKIFYYPLEWIILAIASLWNKFLYKFSGFGEESSQEDFIKIPNSMKPKSMIRIAKKFYPIYALHINSWQIRLLPESKWKKRLQRIALSICPKYNYVIQLLLDSPNRPSKEAIESYRAMTGGRWTGILNTWINDRDIHIIEDPKLIEFNNIDVDYLKKLFYTISCKKI